MEEPIPLGYTMAEAMEQLAKAKALLKKFDEPNRPPCLPRHVSGKNTAFKSGQGRHNCRRRR